MNRDSNAYTFLFAALMVFVVGLFFGLYCDLFKGQAKRKCTKRKMQNILSTIGIQTDRDKAEGFYNQYITQELALIADGSKTILGRCL
jgi:Na+-transporting NADH:ubiquinone oxidoreductase subunit C